MIFNSVPLSVNAICFWCWQLCFTQCQWCLLVLVIAMPPSVNGFMLMTAFSYTLTASMTVCVDDGCVPLSVHGICVHGFAPLSIDILCRMTPLRYGPQKPESRRVRLTVSLRACFWPCDQTGSETPTASMMRFLNDQTSRKSGSKFWVLQVWQLTIMMQRISAWPSLQLLLACSPARTSRSWTSRKMLASWKPSRTQWNQLASKWNPSASPSMVLWALRNWQRWWERCECANCVDRMTGSILVLYVLEAAGEHERDSRRSPTPVRRDFMEKVMKAIWSTRASELPDFDEDNVVFPALDPSDVWRDSILVNSPLTDDTWSLLPCLRVSLTVSELVFHCHCFICIHVTDRKL